MDDLDHGDIDGICAAVAYHLVGSKKDYLDRVAGYFQANARAYATGGSAPAACSSAPERSKQATRR